MTHELTRAAARYAAFAVLVLALAGCESIREAAGVVKEPPDEFAVVTKAPLVIPPDYNLRPPKPGAAPTNQSSPTGTAEAALYGDDPLAPAAIVGNYSPEEKIVLTDSGGATADHAIRKKIYTDDKTMENVNDSFTDDLLFGGPTPDTGKALNADAEANRIREAQAKGQPIAAPGSASPPPKKPDDSATIDKEGDSGGWFGWLF